MIKGKLKPASELRISVLPVRRATAAVYLANARGSVAVYHGGDVHDKEFNLLKQCRRHLFICLILWSSL
jgi:hypothetical protein